MAAKFSIITIVYNGRAGIERTIQSVIEQTNTDYEYIIIDGASSDGTQEIIQRYHNKIAFWSSEPDEGISDAFNKGIQKATGEYLIFMNAGDYFLDDKVLDKVKQDVKENEKDLLVYAIAGMKDDIFPRTFEEACEIWQKAMIPHQSTFIRKELFEKLGMYDTHLKIRMDFDFFARCQKANVSILLKPEAIAFYDMGGISATDHYNYWREGLAIKLLYDLDITKEEIHLWERQMENPSNMNELFQNIECRQCFEKSKKIVIYGAGLAGLHLMQKIVRIYPDKEVYICDSYKAGSQLKGTGFEIEDVQASIKSYRNGMWIISVQSRAALRSIDRMLQQQGIASKQIFLYDEDSLLIC